MKTKLKKEKKGQQIGNIPKYLNCTYKDMKIKAVALGMPFSDVVESDVYGLSTYIANSTNKPDLSLIDKFDDWVDGQLVLLGYSTYDALRSPRLRLGFIGEKDDDGNVTKTKRVKGLKKPKKEKRVRDENGLYQGTKKSYTYELAKEGKSIERTISRVKRKFPDASEKSITIWYRAAIREFKKHEESK